jgi:two-component sensor histidine kinase
MLQLKSGLQRHRSRQRKVRPIASWERALADDLALAYQSLPHADEAQVLDCSAILRRVAVDLGALFGSGGRQLYVNANTECILLQVYKRRALVLLANELVANAILHAFHGRCSGRIDVSLRHLGNGQARLRVADDGIGFSGGLPNFRAGVAAALAGLLEADVRYEAISGWTTVADVVFPALSAPWEEVSEK